MTGKRRILEALILNKAVKFLWILTLIFQAE